MTVISKSHSDLFLIYDGFIRSFSNDAGISFSV